MKTTALEVTPIPGEPDRFWVQSSSRPDVQHLVDMAWMDSPKDKPRAVCSCEQVFAKGAKTCKHIEAIRRFTQEQTKPDYTEKEFEP